MFTNNNPTCNWATRNPNKLRLVLSILVWDVYSCVYYDMIFSLIFFLLFFPRFFYIKIPYSLDDANSWCLKDYAYFDRGVVAFTLCLPAPHSILKFNFEGCQYAKCMNKITCTMNVFIGSVVVAFHSKFYFSSIFSRGVRFKAKRTENVCQHVDAQNNQTKLLCVSAVGFLEHRPMAFM